MHLVIALLLCGLGTSIQAQNPGVVFSELMWMGSTGSNSDEWIELYNQSDAEMDLSDWSIVRLTKEWRGGHAAHTGGKSRSASYFSHC